MSSYGMQITQQVKDLVVSDLCAIYPNSDPAVDLAVEEIGMTPNPSDIHITLVLRANLLESGIDPNAIHASGLSADMVFEYWTWCRRIRENRTC